jgi:hypothetical protein
MKVLFLDVDGVLNNFKERNFGEQFSPSACENLNSLLKDEPDLKIVISSSWRNKPGGLSYVKKIFHKNAIDATKIIDKTGNENGLRGYQIQCWLDNNPGVTNLVIIDDNSDMCVLITKLVKTNMFVGLTSADCKKALDILKKPV